MTGTSAPQAPAATDDSIRPVRPRRPRLSGFVVALTALVLAGAAGWLLWGRYQSYTAIEPATPDMTNIRPQVVTPEPAAEPLADIAASPLVLTYHDVGPEAVGPYNVTNARFSQDMASLHAEGWRTITADQYLGWLTRGESLPERSVLLTFDDGTAGTWRYVDPILERYDAHAVAFIATGWIGLGGYYMTWPEVRALADTGRWEIAAHSHLGHTFIEVDATGTEQPFLINRAWLSGQLESLDEFRQRVDRDLRDSLREFEEQRLSEPRLFAYPFAAATEPTNDPRAVAFTAAEIARLFDAAMTADVSVISTSQSNAHDIPRLGITAPRSLPELFALQEPAPT